MRECCRQVETEEIRNSRNKIHQTWEHLYVIESPCGVRTRDFFVSIGVDGTGGINVYNGNTADFVQEQKLHHCFHIHTPSLFLGQGWPREKARNERRAWEGRIRFEPVMESSLSGFRFKKRGKVGYPRFSALKIPKSYIR